MDAIKNESKLIKKFSIVVLGDSAVGKTSLVYRLINKEIPKTHDSTIEDKYTISYNYDDNYYEIDTSGSEEFQNMTENWVSDSQAFILVYSIDNRESFDKLDFRREIIIKQNKATSPLIIVGNKFDQREARVITFEEAFAKAKAWDAFYIETSTIDNLNCKNCLDQILKVLTNKIELDNNNKEKNRCCVGGCEIF